MLRTVPLGIPAPKVAALAPAVSVTVAVVVCVVVIVVVRTVEVMIVVGALEMTNELVPPKKFWMVPAV